MKTFKSFLGMAVLTLMAASCSNDMNDVQAPEQVAKDGTIHFTATIAPKSFDATTRALVEDTENGVLHSNWAVGEAIIMNYNVKQGDFEKNMFAKAVVTAVNPTTGAATIDAKLAEGAIDGSEISMSYPEEGYTMASDEVQNGELSYKMDVRRGTGTIQVNGTEATLASGAKLDAVYAIVKFTTKDLDGDLLETQRSYVGDCDGEPLVTILYTQGNEFYAALPPTNEYTNTLWFDVWDYDAHAYVAKGTANLEAGKFYQVDLKLATVGDVVLADGSFAKAGTEDAVAMIAHLDGDVETTSHGLAIALEDASSSNVTWDNSGTNNGGKTAAELVANWASSHAVTGGTWRLPSAYDWQRMFIGCGSTSDYVSELTDENDGMVFNSDNFRTKLTAAGGTDVQSYFYWSSTEFGSDSAWMYGFGSAYGKFWWYNKTNYIYVRAALAF